VGVTVFRQTAPDQFRNFAHAFVTMFRIAAGDTFIDGMDVVNPDGSISFSPVAFSFSYIVSPTSLTADPCGPVGSGPAMTLLSTASILAHLSGCVEVLDGASIQIVRLYVGGFASHRLAPPRLCSRRRIPPGRPRTHAEREQF
jgi:hypothetical protein